MKIPFVDLSAIHKPLEQEFNAVFHRVLDRSSFIMGPEIKQFEDAPERRRDRGGATLPSPEVIASQRETDYLLKSKVRKRRLLDAKKRTRSISVERARAKLGI